ncbi:MAG: hypothetical protein AYK22_05405 [Thermoplasmatales archaeon SG8-52-3]|nr:MAG: hypothetical protein AYK22_05405 [Thermoplasmatales archaeon SG8-52-3]
MIKIAKVYIESGGKVIFFSRGGNYEYLAKEINCELIKLKKISPLKVVEEFKKKKGDVEKIPFEKFIFGPYTKYRTSKYVEEEIKLFKKTNIKMIFCTFNLSLSISARVSKIPLMVLISGTITSAYFRSGFASYPDNYENILTKLIPKKLKNYLAKWIYLNNKMLVKDFNYFAKKYNIKPFQTLNDILIGDYTLVCDDIDFLGIKPDDQYPLENFIGPITGGLFEEQINDIDNDVKKHLERPGRSILFSMGSSKDNSLFLKVLDALNEKDYNVVAIYSKINEDKLPKVNENILLKKFIKKPIMVNKMVDLAIIHGGRGTVYNAAYSGKPIIGIPMYLEHQHNINNLIRRGAGISISKKFFKTQDLTNAIENISSNYDDYLKHSQELANSLTNESGENKAVQRLIEIINEQNIR